MVKYHMRIKESINEEKFLSLVKEKSLAKELEEIIIAITSILI